MANRRFNIEILGCALALLVVILLPVFLGCMPVDVPSSAGPSVSTGDASAASLHALGRSMQADVLPELTCDELAFGRVAVDDLAGGTMELAQTAISTTTISTVVGASAARLL